MKRILFTFLIISSVLLWAVKPVPNVVSWQNPGDASIVSTKLYCVLEGVSINYDTPAIEIAMPTLEYDLVNLPVTARAVPYDCKITFMDALGWEGDHSAVKTVTVTTVGPPTPIWN